MKRIGKQIQAFQKKINVVKYEIFDLKIYASIATDAFCRLHNDKYTKF